MKMVKRKTWLAAVAAAALLPCGFASAAPFVNFQLLGSSDGGSTYSSSLQVQAGQTYNFEIVGQLAPIGTTNANGSRTITSETAGTDGIGSASYTLLGADSNPIQISFNQASLALQNGYNNTGSGTGTVASQGAGTNNQLTSGRPVNAPGTFLGIHGSPVVLETGTFTVTAAPNGSTSDVTGTFGGSTSSDKVNGSTFFITSTTENSSDPLQSVAPLALSSGTSVVPEPASLAVFGLGAAGLLVRRRRQTA